MAHSPADPGLDDPRRQRSRALLLQAFFDLVQSCPYGDITVGRVVERAGVARSTFYEHFRGKDELLADSLRGPLGRLADAVVDSTRIAALEGVLAHFWQNRRLAVAILRGAVGRRAQGVLAALLEQRLGSFEPLRVPARLAAVQLAGMLLAGVGDWLEGRQEISAGDLARSLGDSSIAVRRAIQVAG